jgi:hypothetical protein
MDVEPNPEVGPVKTGARTEGLDAVHAALRAADEIAARSDDDVRDHVAVC